MTFKLKGIMWEIRHALKRVESSKNEIVVGNMEDIHEYLAAYNRMDEKEVSEIIRTHSQRAYGKSD